MIGKTLCENSAINRFIRSTPITMNYESKLYYMYTEHK